MKVPALGKLVTRAQVTPESVLRHSPYPPRTPRYRMLLRFGSMASRSPIPRPGMLAPNRNGSGLAFQVWPRLVDRRIAPRVGSQFGIVYVPTAAYTRSGSTSSVARL